MRCTVDGGLTGRRTYLSSATWAAHKVSVGCRYRRGVQLTLLCLKCFGPIIGVSPTLGYQQIFDEFHKYWQCACQIQNINHSSFRFSSVFIYMPEEKQAKRKTTTTPAAPRTRTTTSTTTNSSRRNCCVRVFSLATQTKNDERHRQLVFSVFRIILLVFSFFFMCRLFWVWACLVYWVLLRCSNI